MGTIRVLVASNRKLLREGVRLLIAGCPDVELVGDTPCDEHAIWLVQALQPDVAVVDIAGDGVEFLSALADWRKKHPRLQMVALTDESNEASILHVLTLGAQGYLCAQEGADNLVAAIRTVAANKVYLCPGACGALIREYQRKLEHAPMELLNGGDGR